MKKVINFVNLKGNLRKLFNFFFLKDQYFIPHNNWEWTMNKYSNLLVWTWASRMSLLQIFLSVFLPAPQ